MSMNPKRSRSLDWTLLQVYTEGKVIKAGVMVIRSVLRRVVPFWGAHLIFLFLGIIVAAVPAFLSDQPDIDVPVSAALSVIYFVVFVAMARRRVNGPVNGLLCGSVTVLPMLLLSVLAALYGYLNPADSIGSVLLSFPVILPFLPWVNRIHPAVPIYSMRFIVTLIPWAAIVSGSFFNRSKTG